MMFGCDGEAPLPPENIKVKQRYFENIYVNLKRLFNESNCQTHHISVYLNSSVKAVYSLW